MKKNDEGFTLIELLIVIVILGILATVVVFAVGGITDKGETSACKADVKTVEVAMEAYFAQAGFYPDSVAELLTNDEAADPPQYKLLNDEPEYVTITDGEMVAVGTLPDGCEI
jgi:prepilin-type N-terminal cleavage/methylation domain-containing protein